MNMIFIMHLALVLAGVVIALFTLKWFGGVRGGWASDAGIFAVGLLAVSVVLVLAGFNIITFPGLAVTP
jgi:hypothetical protein